jgi:hypothetical protein
LDAFEYSCFDGGDELIRRGTEDENSSIFICVLELGHKNPGDVRA